jgi:hypothetical protein
MTKESAGRFLGVIEVDPAMMGRVTDDGQRDGGLHD